MNWELFSEHRQERSYVLIFEEGDELIARLKAFAEETGMTAAHFTAIGAFSDVTLAYYDLKAKKYNDLPVPGQVEALSIAGDIAIRDGVPSVHAHGVVGLPDGSTRGGHIRRAIIRPTLELVLVESPRYLQRVFDPRSGLALIDLDTIPWHSRKKTG